MIRPPVSITGLIPLMDGLNSSYSWDNLQQCERYSKLALLAYFHFLFISATVSVVKLHLSLSVFSVLCEEDVSCKEFLYNFRKFTYSISTVRCNDLVSCYVLFSSCPRVDYYQ